MSFVRTYTGRDVSLDSPQAQTIDIRDIACGLSRINRFSGATRLPLNVADHSINVVRWLGMLKAPPITQMLGLLHDAHEAYMGDITTPVRRQVKACVSIDVFRQIADQLDQVIRSAFGLAELTDARHLAAVDLADQAVFAAEWRDLMDGPSPSLFTPAPFAIKPRSPDKAEQDFLRFFERLRVEIGPAHPRPVLHPTHRSAGTQ